MFSIALKNFYKKAVSAYKAPTPAVWYKVGDACLIIGSSFSTYAITQNDHDVALLALVIGTIGKLLTNFFKEDK